METYHIEMISISNMSMNITRKAHDIADAIEMAFEEACCEPKIILFIDVDYIAE